MPTRSQVIASKINQYNAQIVGNQEAIVETAIAKLAIAQLVDAAFSGGGGGGGTSTITVSDGIDQSIDIDTIIARLTTIASAPPLTAPGVAGGIDQSVDIDTVIARLVDLVAKPDGATQADIVAAINAAADIDSLIELLTAIRDRSPVLGAGTIAQSQPVNIASNQIVPINNSQIAGVAVATGVGASNTGTQRVALADGSAVSGLAYYSEATITRAANTAAYIANDVYGSAFELANFASVGGHIILSGVRIVFNIAGLPVGMGGFRLFLYSATPPSAVADNSAFSIPAGDRATILTPKGIDLGSAQLALGGGSVVLAVDNINMQLKVASGQSSVWAYLVSTSGFTPAAPSETASLSVVNLGV